MKRLIVATKNQGKLREIKAILPQYEVLSMSEIGISDDVEETGTTFAENACLKAESVGRQCDCMVIADDSGLAVDALGGAPGIYSARYSGLGDEENNRKLLREMESIKNRSARFICALALYRPGEETLVFEGEMEGVIHDRTEGENGFGYDVLFFLPDYGLTAAQISPEEKNKISHRSKALQKLTDFLKEQEG